jgi:hypothetical protein
MARLPPDNPDDWSEDEWLEWLAEVDEEAPPDPSNPRRRSRSTASSMLGAAMLGLHQVLYGEQQTDIVMVVESDGDPPDPQEVEVYLDPDDPDASIVMVRDEDHREKET